MIMCIWGRGAYDALLALGLNVDSGLLGRGVGCLSAWAKYMRQAYMSDMQENLLEEHVSLKDTYLKLQDSTNTSHTAVLPWVKHQLPKPILLLWRLLQRGTAFPNNLIQLGSQMPSISPLCKDETANNIHILMLSASGWNYFASGGSVLCNHQGELLRAIAFLLPKGSPLQIEMLAMVQALSLFQDHNMVKETGCSALIDFIFNTTTPRNEAAHIRECITFRNLKIRHTPPRSQGRGQCLGQTRVLL
ncbi:hypothetical protein DM860_004094 [Cuscuta australis]|uniref:Uncharacterized protein n=1 Tax=Cuscuta australis TaxID=267555 RepID=A0A328CV81_9ASTE|nr:hypothetical protein DM860_004094 [Cuscuta australis]